MEKTKDLLINGKGKCLSLILPLAQSFEDEKLSFPSYLLLSSVPLLPLLYQPATCIVLMVKNHQCKEHSSKILNISTAWKLKWTKEKKLP